jgi:hypothetical protein
MNPSYEQPGLSLPEPLGVGEAEQAVSEKPSVSSPEVSKGPSRGAMPSANPLSLAVQPYDVPSPVQSQATTTSTTTPGVADDADLIEKEWVMRAKAIVQRTKEDPRQQTDEMNRFKADYLKKRYNKDIKVSEG